MPQKLGRRYEWFDCPGPVPDHLKDRAIPIKVGDKVAGWGCCFPPADEWTVKALETRPQQFKCYACNQNLGSPHTTWHALVGPVYQGDGLGHKDEWIPVDMLCPVLESSSTGGHQLRTGGRFASQPEQG